MGNPSRDEAMNAAAGESYRCSFCNKDQNEVLRRFDVATEEQIDVPASGVR